MNNLHSYMAASSSIEYESFLNRSFLSIDGILTGTTTPG